MKNFFKDAKEQGLEVYTLRFHLNGGTEPPKYPGGFNMNPFPAVPIYQYQGLTMALQKMSAMVFKTRDEVSSHISSMGYTDEFVTAVSDMWQEGKLVKVSIVFVFEGNTPVGWRFLEGL